MWQESTDEMKLLFVHERFGPHGAAEAALATVADELKRRGHTVGIAHGPGTGRTSLVWEEAFAPRFPLGPAGVGARMLEALRSFQPDVVVVHKLADLEVLEVLEDRKSTRLNSSH